jgi:thiamine biosynthesis lipoprotein
MTMTTDRRAANRRPAEPAIATRTIRAIGTSATVAVLDAHLVDEAMEMLADDLDQLDVACSRFRSDSEIRRVEAVSGGTHVPVSPLLFDALDTAHRVAESTAGIVDPTVGSALFALGYDRDFDDLADDGGPVDPTPTPAPGWWWIELDPTSRTVAVPAGIRIDLGSTAKAFAADRAVTRIADALGCGALVNLGGDVAVAGAPPEGGWTVGIAERRDSGLDQLQQVIAVHTGGVATSGTTARTWTRHGRTMHHIVDPWTGEPAAPVWSLVSVAGGSCVEANAWSTAAVVWGDDAVGNLTAHGVDARLVSAEGRVVHIGAWPVDGPTPADHGGPR